MQLARKSTAKDWTQIVAIVGAFVVALAWCAQRFGPRHPAVVLLIVAGALVLLVRWHAARTLYRCPQCGTEFAVGAWRDLVSPNGLNTKYVRCPHCGLREWMEALTRRD